MLRTTMERETQTNKLMNKETQLFLNKIRPLFLDVIWVLAFEVILYNRARLRITLLVSTVFEGY